MRSHPLPSPFLVLATQNPLEQEGTYPLPEAQVDRFMLKVVVGYPERSDERVIIERMASHTKRPKAKRVTEPERLLEARSLLDEVRVDEKIVDYVLDLVGATREPTKAGLPELAPLIACGASVRASIALIPGQSRARLPRRARLRDAARREGSRAGSAAASARPLLRGRSAGPRQRRPPRTHPRPDPDSLMPAIRPDRHPLHEDSLAELLREVRRIEVQSQRLVTDAFAGGYRSVFRGTGIEFDEVREYVPGDDPRSVDWNVTARAGRPFVKKFVDERELTLVFATDLSASMDGGFAWWSSRQMAARITACLCLAAVRNNDRVGFVAFSDDVDTWVPPKKGLRHSLRIVRDTLALRGGRGSAGIGPALETLTDRLDRRAVVFLLSDFQLSDHDEALRRCALRHDLIAGILRVPEWNPPSRGRMILRDPESERAHAIRWSPDRSRTCADEASERHRDLARRLRARGADPMDIPLPRTFDPQAITRPILRLFRAREQRRRSR